MSSGYVVVEVGYEYNDEIYYQPESGGGKPVHMYTSKKKAEQEALQLTASKLRKVDLTTYGHDWGEISSLDFEELKKRFQDIFPDQEITMGDESHMELSFKCGIKEHHRLYRAIERPCPCEKEKWDRWPKDATHEQLLEVAKLLDEICFYTVEKADID